MIRWCSFCQSYIGHKPPLNDFCFSHGICDECDAKKERNLKVEANRQLKDFYDSIFERIHSGQLADPDVLLAQAKALNVPVYQLLIGVLHPLLWQIGQYFEEGKISVAKEQLFSHSVNSLLERLQRPEIKSSVPVVLIVGEGNSHCIGVNFFQHLLADKYAMESYISPTTPKTAEELEVLLNKYQPAVIGISVALPEHINYVWRVSDWLACRKEVGLVVGGPGYQALQDDQRISEHANILHISNPFDVINSAKLVHDVAEGLPKQNRPYG
jgi:methanogenic corrinoid protein MtbC1